MSYVSFYPHTLDEAWQVLAKAKDRARGRLIGNNTRLREVAVKDNDGVVRKTAAIRFHNTDIIVYHPDGLHQTLYMGGWDTVTTKRRLNDFSWASVYSSGGIVHPELEVKVYTSIWHPDTNYVTEPKIWKCRKGKYSGCGGTGRVANYCYPLFCYGAGWQSVGGFHSPRWPCKHGEDSYHKVPCEHGNTEQHYIGTKECMNCQGTGERDYGSKVIGYPFFEYDRVVVDRDGRVCDDVCDPVQITAATQTPPALPKPKPKADYTVEQEKPKPKLIAAEDVEKPLTQAGIRLMHLVDNPVTGEQCYLSSAIIDLNDKAGWSLNQIADWLETLDLDLTFKTPEGR